MSLKRVFAFVLTIALMVSVAVVPARASLATMGSFIALLGVLDDVLSPHIGSANGDAKSVLADAEYEGTVLLKALSVYKTAKFISKHVRQMKIQVTVPWSADLAN